jgi:hypothetical protein
MAAEMAADAGKSAQMLVKLHGAVFNFCGGMMFELSLTDRLKGFLSSGGGAPLSVFGPGVKRMALMPGYTQTATADSSSVFHGREIRKVPGAAGGHGFVLQLSHWEDDPEGWTTEEKRDYKGWTHDSERRWRTGSDLEQEGVRGFKARFGPEAFSLHHRFYLHHDAKGRLWLSAEDGCEGVLETERH